MYIGVDIGGSKTLIASFTAAGSLNDTRKLETQHDPERLVDDIFTAIESLAPASEIDGLGVAVPGHLHDGKLTNTTTLQWNEVPIHRLLNARGPGPFRVENDAVLGGLAEARIGNGQDCTNLLYITISTGVGTGIILNRKAPKTIPGSEGGHMLIGTSEDARSFESLVSGSAFERRFGKPGYKVTDPTIWSEYARDLALGIYNMSTLLQPEVVVIGGGMALHYDRFIAALSTNLQQQHNDMFALPHIRVAKYPELAVVHGCAIIAEEAMRDE